MGSFFFSYLQKTITLTFLEYINRRKKKLKAGAQTIRAYLSMKYFQIDFYSYFYKYRSLIIMGEKKKHKDK